MAKIGSHSSKLKLTEKEQTHKAFEIFPLGQMLEKAKSFKIAVMRSYFLPLSVCSFCCLITFELACIGVLSVQRGSIAWRFLIISAEDAHTRVVFLRCHAALPSIAFRLSARDFSARGVALRLVRHYFSPYRALLIIFAVLRAWRKQSV